MNDFGEESTKFIELWYGGWNHKLRQDILKFNWFRRATSFQLCRAEMLMVMKDVTCEEL